MNIVMKLLLLYKECYFLMCLATECIAINEDLFSPLSSQSWYCMWPTLSKELWGTIQSLKLPLLSVILCVCACHCSQIQDSLFSPNLKHWDIAECIFLPERSAVSGNFWCGGHCCCSMSIWNVHSSSFLAVYFLFIHLQIAFGNTKWDLRIITANILQTCI